MCVQNSENVGKVALYSTVYKVLKLSSRDHDLCSCHGPGSESKHDGHLNDSISLRKSANSNNYNR